MEPSLGEKLECRQREGLANMYREMLSQAGYSQEVIGGWTEDQLLAGLARYNANLLTRVAEERASGINIRSIVEQSLDERGYDGLGCEACSCELDDLMPCDEPGMDCEAGYKGPDPEGECDFVIYMTQEGADAAKAKALEDTDGQVTEML